MIRCVSWYGFAHRTEYTVTDSYAGPPPAPDSPHTRELDELHAAIRQARGAERIAATWAYADGLLRIIPRYHTQSSNGIPTLAQAGARHGYNDRYLQRMRRAAESIPAHARQRDVSVRTYIAALTTHGWDGSHVCGVINAGARPRDYERQLPMRRLIDELVALPIEQRRAVLREVRTRTTPAHGAGG